MIRYEPLERAGSVKVVCSHDIFGKIGNEESMIRNFYCRSNILHIPQVARTTCTSVDTNSMVFSNGRSVKCDFRNRNRTRRLKSHLDINKTFFLIMPSALVLIALLERRSQACMGDNELVVALDFENGIMPW